MRYNSKYYFENKLHQLRPKAEAIHTFTTSDGIKIGMFQGSRGVRPDLDFVVKILRPGIDERLFPPLHSFWVVDLMMKIIEYRQEVKEILEFYIDFYKNVMPFNSKEERANFTFQTIEIITEKYDHI